MHCRSCDFELPDEAKLCTACGAEQTAGPTAATTTTSGPSQEAAVPAPDATEAQAADARALLDLMDAKSSLIADLEAGMPTPPASEASGSLTADPDPKPKRKRKASKKTEPDEAVLPSAPEPEPEPEQVPAAEEPAPAVTVAPIDPDADALALFLAETIGTSSAAEDDKPTEIPAQTPDDLFEQALRTTKDDGRSAPPPNEPVAQAPDKIAPPADEVMATETAAAEKTVDPVDPVDPVEAAPATVKDGAPAPLAPEQTVPPEETSALAPATQARDSVSETESGIETASPATEPRMEPQELRTLQPARLEPKNEPEPRPISARPPRAAGLDRSTLLEKYRSWIYAGAASLVLAGTGGLGYWGWSQKALVEQQAIVIARHEEETLIRLAEEARKKAEEEAAAAQAEAEAEAKVEVEIEEAPAPTKVAAPRSETVASPGLGKEGPGGERHAPSVKPKANPRPDPVAETNKQSIREAAAPAPLPLPRSARPERLTAFEVRSERVEPSANGGASYAPAPRTNESAGSISADLSVRMPYLTATPEELVAHAARCSGVEQCAMIMMAAADPYQELAIQTAMAKAQNYNRTPTGNREAATNLSQQGQVEQKLGNHARAIELFRQALDSDPSHAGTLSLLVQSLLRRGEFEESGKALATALAIDPSRTSTWIEVADLFALKGNRATASSAMILAYRLWPDKVRAKRYFQDRAQNDERLELRPIYQSALRSIQTIPLRGG